MAANNNNKIVAVSLTREEAVAALVEQDVARWGEAERVPSRAQHAHLSVGLALNALASRAEMAGSPDAGALIAAARKALSPADKKQLRAGARD